MYELLLMFSGMSLRKRNPELVHKVEEKEELAFAGSRTRVNRLEGDYANRYTTNAPITLCTLSFV